MCFVDTKSTQPFSFYNTLAPNNNTAFDLVGLPTGLFQDSVVGAFFGGPSNDVIYSVARDCVVYVWEWMPDDSTGGGKAQEDEDEEPLDETKVENFNM